MSSEIEVLAEMLREAETFLRTYGEIHWADWLAKDARLIHIRDENFDPKYSCSVPLQFLMTRENDKSFEFFITLDELATKPAVRRATTWATSRSD